jgi:hypothetical protein
MQSVFWEDTESDGWVCSHSYLDITEHLTSLHPECPLVLANVTIEYMPRLDQVDEKLFYPGDIPPQVRQRMINRSVRRFNDNMKKDNDLDS